jgi:hypothetical protein
MRPVVALGGSKPITPAHHYLTRSGDAAENPGSPYGATPGRPPCGTETIR